jgi:hypothetical protein
MIPQQAENNPVGCFCPNTLYSKDVLAHDLKEKTLCFAVGLNLLRKRSKKDSLLFIAYWR